jgi:hypothetical protein
MFLCVCCTLVGALATELVHWLIEEIRWRHEQRKWTRRDS